MNEVHATYLIPKERLAGMTKLFKKLANKIAKGKTHADFEPTLEVVRDQIMVRGNGVFRPINPNRNYANGTVFAEYVWVTIKYQQPVLNGWSLVAVYDWETNADGERTCYVSPVPGQMVLPEFRNVEDGECNHCNTNRRRNKSMLITKNFLEYKVVGSTCIKDFLGHMSPNSLIDVFSFEQELRGYWTEEYTGTTLTDMVSVPYLFELAAMFTRMYGYRNTSSAGATVDHVINYLSPSSADEVNFRNNNAPSVLDTTTAQQTIKWISEQSTASDYIDTLTKCVKAGVVTHKRFGVVCSAPAVFMKTLADNSKPTSNEWIGTIKDRMKYLAGTVKRVRYAEGAYGTTTIVTITNCSGDELVWFASSALEIEVGEEWFFDATIKAHKEFNGIKQTVLTRVKYVTMNKQSQEAA
jgi:hypothetical protein